MPPAFVLSQDQTLKFDARSLPGGMTRQKPLTSRSQFLHITYSSGYVTRHTNWLITLTIPTHLECASNRQAAARMSLHLTYNVKEPTTNHRQHLTTPFPGLPARQSVVAASVSLGDHRCGETPLGPALDPVNSFFHITAIFLAPQRHIPLSKSGAWLFALLSRPLPIVTGEHGTGDQLDLMEQHDG